MALWHVDENKRIRQVLGASPVCISRPAGIPPRSRFRCPSRFVSVYCNDTWLTDCAWDWLWIFPGRWKRQWWPRVWPVHLGKACAIFCCSKTKKLPYYTIFIETVRRQSGCADGMDLLSWSVLTAEIITDDLRCLVLREHLSITFASYDLSLVVYFAI
jgi:hypothetical protein